MAGPQVEHGYTRIANELFDAILRAGFSKRQLTVVLYVIRKTYGFNKKADTMTYGEIARATGLRRQHVIDALKELAGSGVVQMGKSGMVIRGGEVHSIGLVKNYHDWSQNRTSPDSGLVPKQCPTSPDAGAVTSPKTGPSKDKEKDSPKDNKKREATNGHTLPDWLPSEAWQDWVAYRREVGKKVTPTVAKRSIDTLRRLREQGHDPEQVIAQAIQREWQGLFPLKNAEPQRPKMKSIREATE